MWTGEAYAEFADEDWVLPEAQRLEELRVVAHERLIDAELACGRAVEAIADLESLITAHPVRETFRAQLMLALYRSGRQVDALRVHREYRQYLVDEVGLDPSPAVGDLERRILEHDPSLLLTEPAGTPLLGYRVGIRLGVGPNGTIHARTSPRTRSGICDQRADGRSRRPSRLREDVRSKRTNDRVAPSIRASLRCTTCGVNRVRPSSWSDASTAQPFATGWNVEI